ncbi:MAG: restriction endonuclease, partial [Dolichospermum sp.]
MLTRMPLHIKASSQANKQGKPIFDPIGTNLYIENYLNKLGWNLLPIPAQYEFFGKGIDLA